MISRTRQLLLEDDAPLPGARSRPGCEIDPITGEKIIKPSKRWPWTFAALAFAYMVFTIAMEGRFGQPAFFERATVLEARDRATSAGKVQMIYFGASWCEPCRQMRHGALRERSVENWAHQYALATMVDIDSPAPEDRAAVSAFGISQVPTIVLVRDGHEIGRRTGAMDAQTLVRWAEGVRTGVPANEAPGAPSPAQ